MRRRLLLLRIAKWGGVVVCVTITVAGIANLRYSVLWALADGSGLNMAGGTVGVSWRAWNRQHIRRPPNSLVEVTTYGDQFVGLKISDADEWLFWHFYAGDGLVVAPIWLLFLTIGFPTIVLWRLDRPPKPGHCPCGYDLCGNVSGTCPECGSESKL